jgi:5-methylcytosine-specific restriction enzyme B
MEAKGGPSLADGALPAPAFSPGDCELFVEREAPKRAWAEVSDEEKALAANLTERLRYAAELAAEPLAEEIEVEIAASHFHLRGSAQRDLWACVYPTGAGHKSYALQVALIISRHGAEICCCLGSGNSSVRDPKKLQHYNQAWALFRDALGEVPDELVEQVQAAIDSSELDFGFYRSWRDPSGGGDFTDLEGWLAHAASDQGAQASVSTFIPVAELPGQGARLASLMRDTAEIFKPLFERVSVALEDGQDGSAAAAGSPPQKVEAASPVPELAGEMTILQGPPGTGKTFLAKREAVRIVDGAMPSDEGASGRQAELVDARRIFWVTFHPSYSYEDFVEGFRPRVEDGQLVYEVVDGPFKRACEACGESSLSARLGSLQPGQMIGGNKPYEVRRVTPDGVVLTSEVNRSDAVNPEKEIFTDLWTIERFVERKVDPQELSHAGQNQAARTEVARRAGVSTTLLASAGHYRALYEYLLSDQAAVPRSVVLVIDEINRGDLSRVFGELLTLIESDKRRGGAEETSVILPYSGESFTVPAELSIIGTMNTADRSLAVLDVAFRRRFEFIDIEPDAELCPEHWGGIPVRELLDVWNERLALLESRDARLGHSELMEHRLELVRVGNDWEDDDDGRRRAVAFVLRTKVLPLLLEYFHEDWRRADAVLGVAGLLNGVIASEETQALLEDYLEVDESPSFGIESWWDPMSSDWDGQMLLDALS